ncbi:hypothetical protein ACIQB4_27880 [Streptomyces griseoluteus]|uniref:hypothetical protein n=1 Tax=Streptomyces griseoluteus TaxID=29306 RepID=UPI00381D1C71
MADVGAGVAGFGAGLLFAGAGVSDAGPTRPERGLGELRRLPDGFEEAGHG